MTRRFSFAVALSVVMLIASVGVTRAHRSDRLLGAGFTIDGVHFRVSYYQDRHGDGNFYFDVGNDFRAYERNRCSRFCQRRHGYVSHHSSCPRLGRYFESMGYRTWELIRWFGPSRGRDYYGGDRYDRHHYRGDDDSSDDDSSDDDRRNRYRGRGRGHHYHDDDSSD